MGVEPGPDSAEVLGPLRNKKNGRQSCLKACSQLWSGLVFWEHTKDVMNEYCQYQRVCHECALLSWPCSTHHTASLCNSMYSTRGKGRIRNLSSVDGNMPGPMVGSSSTIAIIEAKHCGCRNHNGMCTSHWTSELGIVLDGRRSASLK